MVPGRGLGSDYYWMLGGHPCDMWDTSAAFGTRSAGSCEEDRKNEVNKGCFFFSKTSADILIITSTGQVVNDLIIFGQGGYRKQREIFFFFGLVLSFVKQEQIN